MSEQLQQRLFYLFTFLGIFTYVFLAFWGNGTGDSSGDSITHYLYARYALQHPELILNHWAKPLFTLLSLPFAQLGFHGIQCWNIALTTCSMYFVYALARDQQMNHRWLIPLFFYGTPHMIQSAISGLTEPLFAAILSIALFILQRNKWVAASILVSFLPFVRSEGLLFCAPFLLYFGYNKKWLALVSLSVGHVLWSIAGYFYYHDILWVFTKIPYANLGSPYGKGNAFHFVEQLYFFFGPLLFVLCLLGCVILLVQIIRTRTIAFLFSFPVLLLFGAFVFFFAAHTSFWVLGIFNSMGLVRVFIAVMPLAVWLMMTTIQSIDSSKLSAMSKRIVYALVGLFCLIFNFTHNPAAVALKGCIQPSAEQEKIRNELIPIIQKQYANATIFATESNVFLYHNHDCFTQDGLIKNASQALLHAHAGDVLVWDNWFGPMEEGLTEEKMEAKTDWEKVALFQGVSESKQAFSLILYRHK